MTDFYLRKKVLVTGSGGLLASHLVEALLAVGADVRVVGRRRRPVQFAGCVEYVQADLLQHEARVAAMRGAAMVFHLAAVGWGLHENLPRAAEILTGNLLLNSLMLDAARSAGIQGYLYTSSSAVYPCDLEELDESAAWDRPPHGSEFAFGWAKRIGEIQAQTYHRCCSMPIAIVRPSNPYGPWDNFDPDGSHVIPALIRRAATREHPFVVWGSGRPVRSFIYAGDAARGMLLALERCATSEAINLASSETVSIADLARLVLDLSDYADAQVVFDTSKSDGHPRKMPSVRRAAEKLGLKEYTPLRLGLEKTIAWYKAQRASL